MAKNNPNDPSGGRISGDTRNQLGANSLEKNSFKQNQKAPPIPTVSPSVSFDDDYPKESPPPIPSEFEIPPIPDYPAPPIPQDYKKLTEADEAPLFSEIIHDHLPMGFQKGITKINFSLQKEINNYLKKIITQNEAAVMSDFDNLNVFLKDWIYQNAWSLQADERSFINLILKQQKNIDPDYLHKFIELRLIHDYREVLSEELSKIQFGGNHLDKTGQILFFQLVHDFNDQFDSFKEKKIKQTPHYEKPPTDKNLKIRFLKQILKQKIESLEKGSQEEKLTNNKEYQFLKNIQNNLRSYGEDRVLECIESIIGLRSGLNYQIDLINQVLDDQHLKKKHKIDLSAIMLYAHQLDPQGLMAQYAIALGEGFEKAAASAMVDKVNIFAHHETLLGKKEQEKFQKEIKNNFYLEMMHDIVARLYNAVTSFLFFVGRVCLILGQEILKSIFAKPNQDMENEKDSEIETEGPENKENDLENKENPDPKRMTRKK